MASVSPYDGSPHANTVAMTGDWPERLDRIVAEWGLPRLWVDAAWLSLGNPAPDDQRRAAAQPSADALSAWQRAWLPDPGPDTLPADRLRALFRAVWCDASDFRHVLKLLVAAHLRLFGPDGETAARDTRDLYVPVASMLGLYRLRYLWMEESTRRLEHHAYATAAVHLGLGHDDLPAEDLEEAMLARQAAWIDPRPNAQLPSINERLHDWEDRLRFFHQLRDDMVVGLRCEFGDTLPEVQMVPLLPGKIAGHSAVRGGDIEQSPEMIVRVLCADVSACYRALGVAHRVAQLLRPGHAPLFRDYISYPQPNGYRALQTVCEWSRNRKNQRIVKFHILTREMHRLNEWGVLAQLDTAPDAWWNRLDGYARRLHGPTAANGAALDAADGVAHAVSQAAPDGEARVVAYLRDHPPGDTSDPIYCFTPIGQLILLAPGSMPLDFAYQLHTQLGHQATRFEINGRVGAIDTELKNGDLVRITLDPLTSHLDFSWLDYVRSRRGRDNVKAGLRWQAHAIHKGRFLFEKALLRRLELYKKDHQRRARRGEPYKPAARTTVEIDRFLRRAALRRGVNVDALYDAIATDHADRGTLAAQLAHQLISEGVIAAVRAADGTALRGDYTDIKLCEACRPTPTDIIRGRVRRRLRRRSDEGNTLIIHADDCAFVPMDDRTIRLQWATPDAPEQWPQFHFDIETDDAHRLLDRILEMVYELPGVYLYRVDARVNQERRATIELSVAAKLPQLCHDLKLHIEQINGARADYHSVPGERIAGIRVVDLSRTLKNPFTESEVYDWRFFDREDISEAIAHWLYAPGNSQILLLHGPRRVGKTSLVLRLLDKGRLEEPTARPVVPVFIDFRKMALPQPRTTAQLIAQRVFDKLGQEAPRMGSGDDPLVWLDARLSQAERWLGQARLLLIIDEFDADLVRLAGAPPSSALRTLSALRALFNTHPAIRWLLIVQDVFLADPRFHEAFPMSPNAAARLGITHLDKAVARRLIVELAARQGVSYTLPEAAEAGALDLPDQIVAWTAGNPWLIHRICYRLLDRAAYKRRNVVTPQDLFLVIHQVLDMPSSVSHYTEHLPAGTINRLIACRLAHAVPPGEWVSLAVLRAELCRRRGLLSSRDLDAHIAFLQRVGVLDTTRMREGRFVGFPIQLVHQWLIENTDGEGNDTPGGAGLLIQSGSN